MGFGWRAAEWVESVVAQLSLSRARSALEGAFNLHLDLVLQASFNWCCTLHLLASCYTSIQVYKLYFIWSVIWCGVFELIYENIYTQIEIEPCKVNQMQ